MKWFMPFLAVIIILMLVGCEETEIIPTPDKVYLHRGTGIVLEKNDPHMAEALAVLVTTDEIALVITDNTLVLAERASGSGFSRSSVSSVLSTIDAGDMVVYYYNMSDVNFGTDPDEYRIRRLYVYH